MLIQLQSFSSHLGVHVEFGAKCLEPVVGESTAVERCHQQQLNVGMRLVVRLVT